jgi:cullin 3
MKVPIVSAKEIGNSEDVVDGDKIAGEVEQDRRLMIDAAIVRTMKARKTAAHNDLIAEVTRQLSFRFVPSPQVCQNCLKTVVFVSSFVIL